jgi:cytochrome c oxidase accessory protein FixG
MTETNTSKTQPSAPADNESIRVLNLYQTAEKIYTRRLEGFFRSLQHWTWIPMLGAYFLIPWFNMHDRQMVWFNLVERKFYVFWLTFWPQDFALLAWLLIIAAFGLFTITNFLGRIWCGFSCPQTVWTQIFMSIEEFFEGDRSQRMKLDAQPWTFNKFWRKTAKQFCWISVALATGLTFVGYFNPIRELVPAFFTLHAQPATIFWSLFFTAATWANAGFMREQVCLYMCPYARFQSAMFDQDTLIVSYNPKRGEQRGSRRKGQDYQALGLGDCVDCTLCVQVCPTGIDIRNGLQYECISCGLCIDACNAVMDKLEYPRGLISFTTENSINKGQPIRLLRPRLMGYFAVLLTMCGVFLFTIVTRVPLEVDIIRDRDFLYRTTADGLVENSYELKIANKDQAEHRYQINVDSSFALNYIGQSEVVIPEGEIAEILVRLTVDPGELEVLSAPIYFIVTSTDETSIKGSQESRFLAPANLIH